MSSIVYRGLADLKGFSLKNCPPMAYPGSVLMCPPDYFDVLDVKNPFMVGHAGGVDKALARRQWEDVRSAFEAAGKDVALMPPTPGLEDMVFCANPAITGMDSQGRKRCVLGRMRYPSRRREVPATEAWLREHGYDVTRLKDSPFYFEGAGDAVWHPAKRLIWGGYGFRSDAESYQEVAKAFDAPVMLLKLVNERFYHLDTCFCPLTPESVLIYPSAFDGESLELILKLFPVVLNATEIEAVGSLACNAAVLDSKVAVVQKGSPVVSRHMAVMGLKVMEVDTSEYMKSGGSVYCMKQFLY